jgi:hypothetical protein
VEQNLERTSKYENVIVLTKPVRKSQLMVTIEKLLSEKILA